MEIRNARMEDVKQIIIILDQVTKMHYEIRPDIFKKKDKEKLEREVLDAMNDLNKKIIVATDKTSKIYGILIYKIKEIKEHINLKDSKILWIDELGVDEQYRKKGIGKELMFKAEKIAKDLDCKSIELNCWKFNKNAINFYKANGMDSQRIIMSKKIGGD